MSAPKNNVKKVVSDDVSIESAVKSRGDGYNWEDSVEVNQLSIPAVVLKELEEKQYSYRWLNAKEMLEKRGLHRSGWKIYRAANPDKVKSKDEFDFSIGVDADGYVRRGDLILGIKPVELQERHKERVREKTRNQDVTRLQQQRAREMRMQAKSAGISDFEAHEGYDEN